MSSDTNNGNQEPDLQVRILVYSQGFREDCIKKQGNTIKIKKKNGTWRSFSALELYSQILDILDPLYKATKKELEEQGENKDYAKVLEWSASLILLAEKARRLYKDPKSDNYNLFVEKIEEVKDDLKGCLPRTTFLDFMYYVLNHDEKIFNEIDNLCNITGLEDEEIINIIKNDIGKEDFKSRLFMYIDSVVERQNVMSFLEREGYITIEGVKSVIEPFKLYKMYKEKPKNYLLKYLSPEELFMLYEEGLIDGKILPKYTKLKDLLVAFIPKETKLSLLRRKLYSGTESEINWTLFEEGAWSLNEIRELADLKYINMNFIVEKYLEQQKRQIAAELDAENGINENKFLEFFSPEYIIDQINNGKLPEKTTSFFGDELKKIYEANERNLATELIVNIKSKNEENQNEAYDEIINLYELGVLSISELKQSEISEEYLMNYYRNNGSVPEMFIEFYNNGLVSGDSALEEFGEDTERVFDMIENLGLDASAIQGWFSTKELINYLKNGNISGENLAKVKKDIELADLEKLYLEEKSLDFSELYGLVEDGVIAKQDADAINEKYDLQAALDELIKRGIRCKRLAGYDNQAIEEQKDVQPDKKKKHSSKEAKGLSPKLQEKFFETIGGLTELIEFNEDHPFYGCRLIPVIDKKVAIIEGNSRTCVLPLKIAIEYVENPGSAEDIFGNATCRKDVYNNKKYISSLNHTKRWGNNVLDAIRDRSTVMTKEDLNKLKEDLNKIKIEGMPLLEALQQSYINRRKGLEL